MAQDGWMLVCRLFAHGSAIRQAVMSKAGAELVQSVRRAVKPATVNQQFIVCPGCDQHSGEVCADGRGGRICCCPECGQVQVEGSDLAAWKLDEDWFRRSLRRALDIQTHDDAIELVDGVWRLGDARHSPVVLARDLHRLLREQSVFGRVRTTKGQIRVIAPKHSQVCGNPFDDVAGVEWLPLEEKFILHGDGISFIDAGDGTSVARSVDPSVPVHGPFSDDFCWVTLKGWDRGTIRLSLMQSAVLRVLWELNGTAIPGERLMNKVGSGSDRPNDLFKLKRGQKGKPEYEGPKFAYDVLVDASRGGNYSIPREKAASLVL